MAGSVGEAAALVWSDVSRADDGSGRLFIRRSKTDRQGKGVVVAVTGRTMADLDAIRPAGAGADDKVFRLGGAQIANRVRAAAKAAGLGDGFTGHSGRVGMARRGTRAGAPVQAVMNQGRWKSAVTVAQYTREESAGEFLRYLE